MRHGDTITKIVTVYFAAITNVTFQYRGRVYIPRPLHVSPLLLREHTCPESCGACCGSFSLDYIGNELRPSEAVPRMIEFDGRIIEVWSDTQNDVSGHWCRNLDDRARCSIHDMRPMACDFELLRFLSYSEHAQLTQKLYGRAWAMKTRAGSVGAMCEMLPADPTTTATVIRKLMRVEQWANHFGIRTKIPAVIDWIDDGGAKALYLPA